MRNSRGLVLTIVICAASYATAAEWSRQPSGFMGITFGSDRRAASIAVPTMVCRDAFRCVDRRQLVASLPVTTEFYFSAGRFVEGVMRFRSADFDDVREMFVELYGAPLSIERKTVRTSAGGERENERLEWRGDRVIVSLMRFDHADSIECVGMVIERGWSDEMDRQLAAQRREALH